MRYFIFFIAHLPLIIVAMVSGDAAYAVRNTGPHHYPTRSWAEMRDEGVTKQGFDYSCGASSVATVMNLWKPNSVDEADVLDQMNKKKERSSFLDMKKSALHFGFKAIGYAVTYEQLLDLKYPVVIYIKKDNQDHFSVLRGINQTSIWLSDPSLGNQTYSKEQFLSMWLTYGKNQEEGKILALFPEKDFQEESAPRMASVQFARITDIASMRTLNEASKAYHVPSKILREGY